jgi:hypothetical protein
LTDNIKKSQMCASPYGDHLGSDEVKKIIDTVARQLGEPERNHYNRGVPFRSKVGVTESRNYPR